MAHPVIVIMDVRLERYVVVMSRLVGALLTLIVRSGLTSKAVSLGTLVITWIVCFTTSTEVMTRGPG